MDSLKKCFFVIVVNHTEILENLDALDGMVILDTKNVYKSEDKGRKYTECKVM